MSRHLVLKNRKFVDINTIPEQPFIGVVPRDLEMGDVFERPGIDGTTKTYKVADKVDEGYGIQVVTDEVTA